MVSCILFKQRSADGRGMSDWSSVVCSSDLGGQATLRTTINALDPIYFSFGASEALFLKAKRAEQAGDAGSPVEVKLQDETAYRWKGPLDFTDNGLDPRQGTIRVRAVVANPELFLPPGMFGNPRLSTGGETGRASCRERVCR